MQNTTKFTSGGKTIGVEVFAAGGSSNGGVIVVAYGSDGLVDNANGPWATMTRGYAADLAGKGFTTMIPNYFQRTGTQAGDIDFQNGGARQIWLHRDEWQATLADAVAHARTMPGVDP
jgi:dienelactone hydrolase